MNEQSVAWVVFSEAGKSLRVRVGQRLMPELASKAAGYLALSVVCFGLASFPCSAQQKSVPHSLPPIFSGSAIHSTAPSSLLPSTDPMRNWFGNDNLLSLAPSSAVSPRSLRNAPNACNGESLICYDYARGQARLPIAKALMPELPGLRKESLSVKRDRVSVNYSF